MSDFLCIRLPFLRNIQNLPFEAKKLWPGLSDYDEQSWMPDYPFNPRMADAILAEMRICDPDRLLQMLTASLDNNASLQAELHDLAKFAGNAPVCDDLCASMRKQAQKVLLWRWLQEGLLTEIESLSKDLAKSSRNLAKILHGEDREGINVDPALTIPWQTVLLNALVFIPDDAVIFVEGSMATDLREVVEFEPLSQIMENAGFSDSVAKKLVGVWAPVSVIAGQQRRKTCEALQLFSGNRLWLCWRE